MANPCTRVAAALLLIGAVTVAAPADPDDHAPPAGVRVVLADGTAVEASSASRTATRVVVHMADGRSLSYPVEEVDLAASRGIPDPPTATEAAAASRPASLAAIAGSLSLEVPEDDPPRGGAPPSATRRNDPLIVAKGDPSPPPSPARTTAPGDPEGDGEASVHLEVAGLSRQWLSYQETLAEVASDCRGYTTGTGAGGCGPGTHVVSRRDTAACQDAVRRARALLPALESAYNGVWASARRLDLSPGDVRRTLAASGLGDFRSRLKQEQARLDGLAH